MKFTVIIPTYNRALFLRRALRSLTEQTEKKFKVIVCDDGSTDNTAEIINEFVDLLNLEYIYLENSGGPARPRNIAARKSTTDWLCFLDADDFWFNNKLAICNQFTQTYDFLFHDMTIQDIDSVGKGLYKGRDITGNAKYDLLVNFNPIATSSVCIRKELFLQVGDFDERQELSFIEDFDYWLRTAALNARFKYISQSLGAYIEHTSNSSGNYLSQKTKLHRLYSTHSDRLTDSMKKQAFASYNYLAGCLMERARDYNAALQCFYTSSKSKSFKIRAKSLLKIIKYLTYGRAVL